MFGTAGVGLAYRQLGLFVAMQCVCIDETVTASRGHLAVCLSRSSLLHCADCSTLDYLTGGSFFRSLCTASLVTATLELIDWCTLDH